jgi:hypothetical protein
VHVRQWAHEFHSSYQDQQIAEDLVDPPESGISEEQADAEVGITQPAVYDTSGSDDDAPPALLDWSDDDSESENELDVEGHLPNVCDSSGRDDDASEGEFMAAHNVLVVSESKLLDGSPADLSDSDGNLPTTLPGEFCCSC